MGNVNPFSSGQTQQTYTPPPRRVDSEKPLTGNLFDKDTHLKDGKLNTKGWNSVFQFTNDQFDTLSSSSTKTIISQSDIAKALGKHGVSTEDAKKVYEKISKLDGEDGISKSEMATLNVALDKDKDGEITDEEMKDIGKFMDDAGNRPKGIFGIEKDHSDLENIFEDNKMKDKETNWEKTDGQSVEDPDKDPEK